jgi:hypothetical protein
MIEAPPGTVTIDDRRMALAATDDRLAMAIRSLQEGITRIEEIEPGSGGAAREVVPMNVELGTAGEAELQRREAEEAEKAKRVQERVMRDVEEALQRKIAEADEALRSTDTTQTAEPSSVSTPLQAVSAMEDLAQKREELLRITREKLEKLVAERERVSRELKELAVERKGEWETSPETEMPRKKIGLDTGAIAAAAAAATAPPPSPAAALAARAKKEPDEQPREQGAEIPMQGIEEESAVDLWDVVVEDGELKKIAYDISTLAITKYGGEASQKLGYVSRGRRRAPVAITDAISRKLRGAGVTDEDIGELSMAIADVAAHYVPDYVGGRGWNTPLVKLEEYGDRVAGIVDIGRIGERLLGYLALTTDDVIRAAEDIYGRSIYETRAGQLIAREIHEAIEEGPRSAAELSIPRLAADVVYWAMGYSRSINNRTKATKRWIGMHKDLLAKLPGNDERRGFLVRIARGIATYNEMKEMADVIAAGTPEHIKGVTHPRIPTRARVIAVANWILSREHEISRTFRGEGSATLADVIAAVEGEERGAEQQRALARTGRVSERRAGRAPLAEPPTDEQVAEEAEEDSDEGGPTGKFVESAAEEASGSEEEVLTRDERVAEEAGQGVSKGYTSPEEPESEGNESEEEFITEGTGRGGGTARLKKTGDTKGRKGGRKHKK